MIARFEDQRGFFGDDQHIKAAEEIEIVSVHENFGRRYDGINQPRQPLRRCCAQAKFHQLDPRRDGIPTQSPHLTGKQRVGRCDKNFRARPHLGQCKRDWQAMSNLVRLIMVEQEANAHERLLRGHRPRV